MTLIDLRRTRVCIATVLTALAAIVPTACKDSPPTAPQVGSLRVSIVTSGGDWDDGYDLIVDSSQRLPINSYGSVVLESLSAGTHVLALDGVADNCEVTGTHPLSVTVTPDDTTKVILNVQCDVTGIEVRTRVTGLDIPARVEVLVGGGRSASVDANGSIVFSRVLPGSYTISLSGVGDNCTVTGGTSVTINVSNRKVTSVTFEIACEATGVKVTTHTTGQDLPGSFDVIIGGIPSGSVAANGSVVVSRLRAGSHTVSLGRVSTNCKVTGDNPVTLEVPNRTVTSVAFEVACVPTNKRIAFVLDSAATGIYGWILTADADGSAITQLAPGYGPAWAPDGAKLAFSNTQCDYYYNLGCTGGVVFIEPNTSTTNAPNNVAAGFDPALSPDGNLVAFTRTDTSARVLYLARLDGSPPVRLRTPASSEWHPTWSPDGERIAFMCALPGQNVIEICVIKRDGTEFKQLTNNTVWDGSPAWSPDGSKIAFTSQRPNGGADIWLMTPSGTDLVRLTGGYDPAWSPDGSKLVFAGADGLFTIRADGSELTRLTRGRHRDPAWRP